MRQAAGRDASQKTTAVQIGRLNAYLGSGKGRNMREEEPTQSMDAGLRGMYRMVPRFCLQKSCGCESQALRWEEKARMFRQYRRQ